MKTTSHPLVSIVVPAYNYARFLGACIDSILAQTYPHWELIIVDNGSTDNTQEVLGKYTDPRIKSLRIEINQGPVKAWALGYSHCRGEYFALLPADDLFLPTKLEKQIQFLQQNPAVGAVGTYICEIDDDGKSPTPPGWIVGYINQPIDYADLANWRWRHYLCIPTAIYSKKLCDQADAVPCDGLNNVCDWDFHVRLLGAGAVFAVIPEALTCYRWHQNNTSHKKRSDAHSQWIYSHLKSYIPALRKIRPYDYREEIGKCIKAVYAAPNASYWVDEVITPRRCAHLEALLDPESGLQEFSSFLDFLSYASNWAVDSENRAALAALDSAIMELRSRLLSPDPSQYLMAGKPLFPLEVRVLELQGQLGFARMIRRKCQSLKRLCGSFCGDCRSSLQNVRLRILVFIETLRGKIH